jgi:hypothetical protein
MFFYFVYMGRGLISLWLYEESKKLLYILPLSSTHTCTHTNTLMTNFFNPSKKNLLLVLQTTCPQLNTRKPSSLEVRKEVIVQRGQIR